MIKILIFEKFIGINNVLGSNGIIKYVNEGIICSINKNIKLEYINFCLSTLPPQPSNIVSKQIINNNKKPIFLRLINNSITKKY